VLACLAAGVLDDETTPLSRSHHAQLAQAPALRDNAAPLQTDTRARDQKDQQYRLLRSEPAAARADADTLARTPVCPLRRRAGSLLLTWLTIGKPSGFLGTSSEISAGRHSC
jgi:hypothetical protein